MLNANVLLDQRQHKRFRLQSDAFVILRLPHTVIGRIINISMDGMCFDYLIGKDQPVQPAELEIVATLGRQRTFQLNNIPCQAIWDVISHEDPLAPVMRKRCGVQFGDLTERQEVWLRCFIQNHTIGD